MPAHRRLVDRTDLRLGATSSLSAAFYLPGFGVSGSTRRTLVGGLGFCVWGR